MSSGVVHTKASIILASGFLIGSIVIKDLSGIKYSIGSLIGIFIQPDWDVDSGFEGDKIIRERFGILGYFLEKLWDIFLWPYRKSLKHASFLSHFPPVGTIGRIAYSYFFLIVVPYSIVYIYKQDFDILQILSKYWQLIVSEPKIILGLAASDFVHFGLDILTTDRKKGKENGKKRKSTGNYRTTQKRIKAGKRVDARYRNGR